MSADTEKEWGVERRNQPRLRGMQRMADVSKARILVRKRKEKGILRTVNHCIKTLSQKWEEGMSAAGTHNLGGRMLQRPKGLNLGIRV